MSATDFINYLESIKMEPDMFHIKLTANPIFGFDVKADRRTYLTDDIADKDKGIVIENQDAKELHHICVDGGLVTYGLEDYVGDGRKHGRFDSMLFSDDVLLLVEYKMESTTEKDNNRWRRFSDGMNQISEYFLHLRQTMLSQGLEIESFFTIGKIVPFVCMNNIPQMKPRVNAQRFRQMEEFRVKTGLKIRYGTSWKL